MPAPREFWTLLRRSRHVTGGRELGVELDCLGAVLVILRDHFELDVRDAWANLLDACSTKGALGSGLPAGWARCAANERRQDADVLLYFDPHPGVGVVVGGRVWSSSPTVGGPFCVPLTRDRRRVHEVYRHGSRVPAARSPG